MTKKTDNASAPAAAKPAAAKEAEITLDEFCMGLSSDDDRVEMIGGFHAVMRREGRTRATRAAFGDLFQKFAAQPA